jgi:hypothetical protein
MDTERTDLKAETEANFIGEVETDNRTDFIEPKENGIEMNALKNDSDMYQQDSEDMAEPVELYSENKEEDTPLSLK